jgi:hypothetical protein
MVAFAFLDGPAARPSHDTRPVLAGRRVFVARREPTDRRFSSTLRGAGATVAVGDGAASAVRAIRGGRLDAVLIDATDDPEEGQAAARILRQIGFEGLIFAVCEEPSDADAIAWTVEAGVDRIIPASDDPADLPGRLADHLLRASNASEDDLSFLTPTLR